MKTLPVKSLRHSYQILVGRDLLANTGTILKLKGLDGKVLILTQKNIAKRYLPGVQASLKKAGFLSSVCYVPDGERAKDVTFLLQVFEHLVRSHFERRDVLLALGGGVVGDLGGFAASTYLRGITFVNAATTLLAQVDSAIGGKTAVNLPEGKNLAGTFYPPRLVLSDAGVLRSLPRRQLCASLAEVVKYGMIRDGVLFRILEKEGGKLLNKDARLLETVVLRCSRIKAAVVSRDEFETHGERMILNYGHTFGHAFEKAGAYRDLLHGEAVSIGMVCAARLAVHLGLLSPAVELRQRRVLEKLTLPVKLEGRLYRTKPVLEAMMRDKKRRAGKLRFVLPEKIGSVRIFDDVPPGVIKRVLKETGVRD